MSFKCNCIRRQAYFMSCGQFICSTASFHKKWHMSVKYQWYWLAGWFVTEWHLLIIHGLRRRICHIKVPIHMYIQGKTELLNVAKGVLGLFIYNLNESYVHTWMWLGGCLYVFLYTLNTYLPTVNKIYLLNIKRHKSF